MSNLSRVDLLHLRRTLARALVAIERHGDFGVPMYDDPLADIYNAIENYLHLTKGYPVDGESEGKQEEGARLASAPPLSGVSGATGPHHMGLDADWKERIKRWDE